MKIRSVTTAKLGQYLVVRVATDEGADGWGPVEHTKPYLGPFIDHLAPALIGEDPTHVERVMLKIRQRGAFKPYGAAVSAVEIALWDLAGKAAGLPIHRLLGGKVRDKVRVYNGAVREPMTSFQPKDFAAAAKRMKAAKEGFTIVKQGIGFHSGMKRSVPGFFYGEVRANPFHGHIDRGLLTERGLNLLVECATAMKEVLGDGIGLALDCGPGMTVQDAIRFAKAVEPLNLLWLEDMVTGDYTPYVNADLYREVTRSTSTPIHTGEQIYLRQHFKQLIEGHAVSVVGPDPCDMGGIAELKWVAEYADLHGIMMAPHGVADGLIGLAALVQVSATLPDNYIAFEYPAAKETWWYEILKGLPDPIVKNGFIEVWDRPGLGVEFDVAKAKKHLAAEDAKFFD